MTDDTSKMLEQISALAQQLPNHMVLVLDRNNPAELMQGITRVTDSLRSLQIKSSIELIRHSIGQHDYLLPTEDLKDYAEDMWMIRPQVTALMRNLGLLRHSGIYVGYFCGYVDTDQLKRHGASPTVLTLFNNLRVLLEGERHPIPAGWKPPATTLTSR